MSLQTQIKEDMKAAMKAKESQKLMALRGVLSSFTNKLVDLGKTPQDELGDDDAIAVIKTEVKRRKDSIQQYTEAGRPELAEDEQLELDVLSVYLPETMSRDAIREIAQKKKDEMGITDKSQMGQFMGALMQELGSTADGGDVKAVVDELLG
ncbi:GatB/YqeY domain-containing protein [Candidatus Nomurabacteria bacterium]|nr:GatB/YqeY domain-containing protein [Candidatus Nomurabacteria bacterium]